MAYKPGHFTEDWIPYDTMIPKKCSDAHTLFRTIVYAEDFCKKHSWEEQMRIKEEECRPLFTDYLDVFEEENPKYQHIYPCRMVNLTTFLSIHHHFYSQNGHAEIHGKVP